jgi:Putative zinc-finger
MECSVLRDERLDVLYGEADPVTRARVEEHLAACSTCREEMAALRVLRGQLAAWEVPQGLRKTVRLRPAQGFLAAAAVLLLAVGAAFGLSGSEVRYEKGELAFRLGGDRDLRRLLAEQDARHHEEIQALQASISTAPRAEPALLPQVEEMIQKSESRQGELLRTSLGDWSAKKEAQRRYDMARISAGLSYLDGKNGQHVARTTELMGYVLEAAQKR